MHSGERPVDDRVQGAIELLNSAIDNVNLLEDEKNCLAKQVTAAASVEGVLDREVSAVESRLAPLHDALDAESVASSAAGEAEKRSLVFFYDVSFYRLPVKCPKHSHSRIGKRTGELREVSVCVAVV